MDNEKIGKQLVQSFYTELMKEDYDVVEHRSLIRDILGGCSTYFVSEMVNNAPVTKEYFDDLYIVANKYDQDPYKAPEAVVQLLWEYIFVE